MEKRHISSRYKISTRSVKVPARHIDGVYERPLKVSTKKTQVVVNNTPAKSKSSSNTPKTSTKKTAVTSNRSTTTIQPSPTTGKPQIIHRVIHEYYQTINNQPVQQVLYPQYATTASQMIPPVQRQVQQPRQQAYSQPMMQNRQPATPMYNTVPNRPANYARPQKNNLISKISNKLNGYSNKKTGPKSTKLNPSDIIRYAVVTVFVVLAGYLAYDTWQTNQQVQNAVRGDSASAQTYESSADVNNPPMANGEAYPDYKVAADQPRILAIPSINVTARMTTVGLTSNSKIDVPSDSSFAGWYTGASVPGSKGAAFVTGHYNGTNAGGVFDNLGAINIGDQITIEMGDGSIKKYEVVQRETQSTSQVDMTKALSVIDGEDEGLNIMTCAGAFTGSGFADRLTIYAKRV